MHEEDNVKTDKIMNPLFERRTQIFDFDSEQKTQFIGKHYGLWKQLEKLNEETDELRHINPSVNEGCLRCG